MVLYMGLGGFGSFRNQLDIYFLTDREQFIGIDKPKNIFRLILSPSIKYKKNLI